MTDDVVLARQLRYGLIDDGVHAVTGPFRDPPAVVSAVRRSAAAAVLLDLDLPHAGALAVLAGLRSAPGVPSLVCTRRPAPRALRPAFERGAAGCLAGQLRPHRVALALHAVLRGEPVLSPALTRQLFDELSSAAPTPGALDAHGVTRREREVLGLLAEGRRTAEVASDLALSTETVRGHVKSALRKLDVRTCAAAVALLVAERVAPTLTT
ncbi:MAG: response regulator transcription factor [Gaiellales bacterium]